MLDLRACGEEHLSSVRAHRRTKIDIFRVQEEPFVEEAGGFEIGTTDHQAGSAHPVDLLTASRHALDGGGNRWHSAIVAGDEDLLAQLGEGTDHAPERQFGVSISIHDSWSDDGRVLPFIQRADEAIDRTWSDTRIRIQEQHELTGRFADADVV